MLRGLLFFVLLSTLIAVHPAWAGGLWLYEAGHAHRIDAGRGSVAARAARPSAAVSKRSIPAPPTSVFVVLYGLAKRKIIKRPLRRKNYG